MYIVELKGVYGVMGPPNNLRDTSQAGTNKLYPDRNKWLMCPLLDDTF